MFSSIAIILIFILMAVLMFLKKLPAVLALPAMAILISVVAGVTVGDVLKKVISDGSIKLAVPMVTVFFGAMLGQLIKNAGIAKAIVRWVAELSGDNPFWISLVMLITTALLFSVLGGLGAVIMVATIILPVMLSIGVPSITAASIFLIGISLGGIINLTNWQLYMSVLSLSQNQILKFAIPLIFAMTIISIIFLLVELRKQKISYLCASEVIEKNENISVFSLFTPAVPLLLVLGFSFTSFEFPIISAMFIGLLYGLITTWKGTEGSINLMTKSVIEGVSSAAPAIALIMGIGMVLNAVMHPQVANTIQPVISAVLPGNMLAYIIIFSILAPLSLYRGPLNIWGLGSGIIGIMLGSGILAPAAIMAAMMSVGQIQGVCDPTNTHNVWIANHLNISVQDILKKTLPYIWVLSVIGLIIAGFLYF